jgi:Fe-S-cluster-containing hydrogenase component 2
MCIEIDYAKCDLCGGYAEPLCIDRCPDEAMRVQEGKIVVTEFLCEDCNECGFVCPTKAITISVGRLTF